jgi:hypothetical protein
MDAIAYDHNPGMPYKSALLRMCGKSAWRSGLSSGSEVQYPNTGLKMHCNIHQ